MGTIETKRLDIFKALENVKNDFFFRGVERSTTLAEFEEDDMRKFLMGIGERFVRGFELDASNKDVYENVRKWADARPFTCMHPLTKKTIMGDTTKGLYICGPTGSGKSVLVSIIRAYLKALHAKIRVGNSIEPMEWEPRRADDICVEYSRTGDLEQFMKARILCIHDMGSEQEETLYMGNRVNVIRTILEYRGDRNNLITIITSNDTIEESKYGERVKSRLCEMCNYFELVGKDRRIRK